MSDSVLEYTQNCRGEVNESERWSKCSDAHALARPQPVPLTQYEKPRVSCSHLKTAACRIHIMYLVNVLGSVWPFMDL
jgi:hypothetical protein